MATKKKVFIGEFPPVEETKRWVERPEDGAEVVLVHRETITRVDEFVPRCPSTVSIERTYEPGVFDTLRCQGEVGHPPQPDPLYPDSPHYHWTGMMGRHWDDEDSDQAKADG